MTLCINTLESEEYVFVKLLFYCHPHAGIGSAEG